MPPGQGEQRRTPASRGSGSYNLRDQAARKEAESLSYTAKRNPSSAVYPNAPTIYEVAERIQKMMVEIDAAQEALALLRLDHPTVADTMRAITLLRGLGYTI